MTHRLLLLKPATHTTLDLFIIKHIEKNHWRQQIWIHFNYWLWFHWNHSLRKQFPTNFLNHYHSQPCHLSPELQFTWNKWVENSSYILGLKHTNTIVKIMYSETCHFGHLWLAITSQQWPLFLRSWQKYIAFYGTDASKLRFLSIAATSHFGHPSWLI